MQLQAEVFSVKIGGPLFNFLCSAEVSRFLFSVIHWYSVCYLGFTMAVFYVAVARVFKFVSSAIIMVVIKYIRFSELKLLVSCLTVYIVV